MPSDAVEIPRPDFLQLAWDERLAGHAAARAREWLAEDLGCECDWTSVWLVPDTAVADLLVTARAEGLIAGLPLGPIVAAMVDEAVRFEPLVAEGSRVTPGDAVARLAGPVRDVLTIERTLLNALGRMSGVATATAELVREAAGRACRVYDTRKTVPGWRMLDKYAVRVGGGWNHRLGLADAILIKDNHLAELRREGFGAAEAVRRARGRMQAAFPPRRAASTVVEVELDRLDEFREVLEAGPDVVLLDNMPPPLLREAVALRDRLAPSVILEASGGIRPGSIAAVAAAGVERISTGWPTHASAWLDLGLDWATGPGGGNSPSTGQKHPAPEERNLELDESSQSQ